MRQNHTIIEQSGGLLDCLTAYKFIEWMTTDFKDTNAFKAGVIDADGKFLVPFEKQTNTQQKSYNKMHVIVWNLKKILNKVPGMKSKLSSAAAALFLLREESTKINGGAEAYTTFAKWLNLPKATVDNLFESEFDAVVAAGRYVLTSSCVSLQTGANVPMGRVVVVEQACQPIGILDGVSVYCGVDERTHKPVLFVKEGIESVNSFAGAPVFEVDSSDYATTLKNWGRERYQRWSDHLDMSKDNNKIIRSTHHSNTKKPLIIKNRSTGEMTYLVKGR